MKCPHCGGKVLSQQERYALKRLAEGRCRKCRMLKLPIDGPYQMCRECRLRASEYRRTWYRRLHPNARKFSKREAA